MRKEVNEKGLFYVTDDTRDGLSLLTLQKEETGKLIAKRLRECGLSANFNSATFDTKGVEVFDQESNPMTLMEVVDFIHEHCSDIIDADEFFDEEPQDNHLRIVRACQFLANPSLGS